MPEKRERTGDGRWKKGSSGNPGGRPRKPEILKTAGPQALELLVSMMNDEKTQDKLRADIGKWIAEMEYGKPKQAVDMDAEVSGGAVSVRFEGELAEWAK